jgi:hypothetical protein
VAFGGDPETSEAAIDDPTGVKLLKKPLIPAVPIMDCLRWATSTANSLDAAECLLFATVDKRRDVSLRDQPHCAFGECGGRGEVKTAKNGSPVCL